MSLLSYGSIVVSSWNDVRIAYIWRHVNENSMFQKWRFSWKLQLLKFFCRGSNWVTSGTVASEQQTPFCAKTIPNMKFYVDTKKCLFEKITHKKPNFSIIIYITYHSII